MALPQLDPKKFQTIGVPYGPTNPVYAVNKINEIAAAPVPQGGGGQPQSGGTGRVAPGGGVPRVDPLEGVRRNVGVTQSGYEAGGRQTATDIGNTYGNNLRGFINSIESGQQDINSSRVNNALNLRRTMGTIVNGVRTGLRSGGVTLANMNAADSGATEALARAYATMGNNQAGDADNEAALKEQEIGVTQGRFNRDREQGITGFDTYKETETGRIRNELLSKLQVLDTTARNEGLDGGVDMGIVDRVVSDALARLAAADQQRSRLAGVRALTPEEVAAQAAQMDAAGAAGTSPFAVDEIGTSVTPESMYGGAPITQLPFFLRRARQMA